MLESDKNVVSGTLAAAATPGTAGNFRGDFNLHVVATGFTGTFHIERNIGGAGFVPLAKDTSGAANSYTGSLSLQMHESESAVSYRVVCDTRSAGSIAYRISQDSQ